MVHKCPHGEDRPGSPWDYALVAAAGLAALPFIGANVVIATRMRRRPYIIAQGGTPLILLSSASSFLWLLSTFVTTRGHIPRNDFGVLHACILWDFWLRLAFGLCLWLVSIILRLYRLYLLGVSSPAASSDKAHRTWTLHLPLLWAPTLILIGTATALHANHTSGDNICAHCHISKAWKWISFAILTKIYLLILLFLLLKLRNCKDYMVASEFKCTSEFSLRLLLCTLLYIVTIVTGSDKAIAGRCFVSFCVCCLVYVHFWVRMGLPVYLYLFKGEPQLDSFEEELLCCGAECFNRIHSPSSCSPERVFFPAQGADWILRATSAAVVELSECKERIHELEVQKSSLSTRIKELQVLMESSCAFSLEPHENVGKGLLALERMQVFKPSYEQHPPRPSKSFNGMPVDPARSFIGWPNSTNSVKACSRVRLV